MYIDSYRPAQKGIRAHIYFKKERYAVPTTITIIPPPVSTSLSTILYFCFMSAHLNVITAIKRMKQLTDGGIPFRIEYFTLSGKYKVVEQAMIRPGYSKRQSSRYKFLIGYTDLKTGEHRQFHRALLFKINAIDTVR